MWDKMQTKGILTIAGLVMLPIFFLLLSSQLTLLFYPLTPTQEEVFRFLAEGGGLNLNYTAAEISHLQDVATVMGGVNVFFYASGVALLFILLYFWKDKSRLHKLLRYGGIASMAMIGILFLGILLAFNSSFTLFHQLFFPQGNWQFAADSLLIQTFPMEFFVRISGVLFGGALILGIGLFLLSVLLEKNINSTT